MAAGGSAATVGDVAMLFVDNVIIRNIAFEDAFDYFPAWTPTDSYVTPPTGANPASLYPRCQATIDAAGDLGPHQCPGDRWNSENDNISVANATHVWIDHCTSSDGAREDHLVPSVWQALYVGHDYQIEHGPGRRRRGSSDSASSARGPTQPRIQGLFGVGQVRTRKAFREPIEGRGETGQGTTRAHLSRRRTPRR